MMTLRHIPAAEMRHQQRVRERESERERERDERESGERKPNRHTHRERERGIFSTMGLNSSFLASLVNKSY